MAGKYLESLQALRGLAALGVLVAHLGSLHGYNSAYPAQPTWFPGVLGVDVFFITSGFVMYYITADNWGKVGCFLLNRAIRIYPMYWIVTCYQVPALRIVGMAIIGNMTPRTEYFLKSLLLIPVLAPATNTLMPPVEVGWTLFYEALFYLVFGLLQFGSRKYLTLKVLGVLGLAFIYGLSNEPNSLARIFLGNSVIFEFAVGCFLAKLFILQEGAKKKLRITLWLNSIVGCALIFVGIKYLLPDYINLPRVLAFGLAATGVVLLGITVELGRWTIPRPLRVIGDASYSLYLTHPILIGVFVGLLQPLEGNVSGKALLYAVMAATILTSVAIHYAIEKPIHILLHRFSRRALLERMRLLYVQMKR